MKINQVFVPLTVFLAFLFFGRWTGMQIQKTVQAANLPVEAMLPANIEKNVQSVFAEGSIAPQSAASHLPDNIGDDLSTNNRQKNILVIGVDDLSQLQPNLVGIWLVLYLPDRPLVTLMPIYPMVSTQPDQLTFSADADLSGSFKLNADRSPNQGLLNRLKEKGLWWTNFAVLDRNAMEHLFQLGRIPNSKDGSDQKQDASIGRMSRIPDPADKPQAALLSQAHVIQELCHTGNLTFSTGDIARVIRSMKDHLATDVSASQVVGDLKGMLLNGGGFICEFPSLKMDPGSLSVVVNQKMIK